MVATAPTASAMLPPGHNSLKLRHAALVFTSPRSVFARIEDTGAYGWAMLTLLVLVFVIGVAQVQTGLIDRDVDRRTEARLAELEESHGELVDRVELKIRLEKAREQAVFEKLMMRIVAVGAMPGYFLASFLLIASVFYALVALTGRKPEFHTLMSICVHAGFIELVGCAVGLAMMLAYKTTAVDTSLSGLGTGKLAGVLSGVDPFRIWFWILVGMGLVITRQLSRRMAIGSCVVLGLLAMGIRAAIGYAAA
ncbi:MAG: YIP1 family protein [Phycisphaerae bacterium]